MEVLNLIKEVIEAQQPHLKERPNKDKKMVLSTDLYNQLILELEQKAEQRLDLLLDVYYQGILVEEFGTMASIYVSISLKWPYSK